MLTWLNPHWKLESAATAKVRQHSAETSGTQAKRALTSQERPARVTQSGTPITWFVEEQEAKQLWIQQIIPGAVAGLTRDITVYRAPRKSNLIVHDWHGDEQTFCPPMWWDLAIGSGACGLGCRACFLMLTHRIRRDPLRHLLYDNLEDFTHAAEKWLKKPERRRQHTLGVGIDRSDSLLYEGVAPHVRNLAPLFSSPTYNPLSNKLVLLTKSTNTHYLADIASDQRRNIVASFSLNPEAIADLWEGKWPDTNERITPPIRERLMAVKQAQELGFEVRVRLDPILTPVEWADSYRGLIAEIKGLQIDFRYWTLGTYREKNPQLDAWRGYWGLPPMEWQPSDEEMEGDGTHRHIASTRRIHIYQEVRNMITEAFPQARISLCKETHKVRKMVGLCNADCNCLV